MRDAADAARRRVALRALNGQPDPAGCAPTPFEAYPATRLRGITPVGGPADGGTLVEVKGSGFASGTSLDCCFETEAEATVVTAARRRRDPPLHGAASPTARWLPSPCSTCRSTASSTPALSFAYLPSPELVALNPTRRPRRATRLVVSVVEGSVTKTDKLRVH